jgi:hypothetical protein
MNENDDLNLLVAQEGCSYLSPTGFATPSNDAFSSFGDSTGAMVNAIFTPMVSGQLFEGLDDEDQDRLRMQIAELVEESKKPADITRLSEEFLLEKIAYWESATTVAKIAQGRFIALLDQKYEGDKKRLYEQAGKRLHVKQQAIDDRLSVYTNIWLRAVHDSELAAYIVLQPYKLLREIARDKNLAKWEFFNARVMLTNCAGAGSSVDEFKGKEGAENLLKVALSDGTQKGPESKKQAPAVWKDDSRLSLFDASTAEVKVWKAMNADRTRSRMVYGINIKPFDDSDAFDARFERILGDAPFTITLEEQYDAEKGIYTERSLVFYDKLTAREFRVDLSAAPEEPGGQT